MLLGRFGLAQAAGHEPDLLGRIGIGHQQSGQFCLRNRLDQSAGFPNALWSQPRGRYSENKVVRVFINVKTAKEITKLFNTPYIQAVII